MLGLESMEQVLHGESSHPSKIKTTRNWFEHVAEQARACRIVVRMSISSYSELARLELIQR